MYGETERETRTNTKRGHLIGLQSYVQSSIEIEEEKGAFVSVLGKGKVCVWSEETAKNVPLLLRAHSQRVLVFIQPLLIFSGS